MRVAIVGAGAAGLVTAWLVSERHDVAVYERAPIVGGNVRTLGGNVPWSSDERVDAGVIELERTRFPTVFRLLGRLGVQLVRVPGTTTLFPRSGPRWYSPRTVSDAGLPPLRQLRELLRLQPLRVGYLRLKDAARTPWGHRGPPPLRDLRLDEVLGSGPYARWMALLVMYAWSIELPEVGGLAAELAVPMLRRFADASEWFGVEGGVFAYQAAILARLRGRVHTGVDVRVRRDPDGVVVAHPDGTEARFDAVVLAVPPHRVLGALADADVDERRRFGGCQGRLAHVLIHDDLGPYTRRGHTYTSEFDVFELPGGQGGYNARLDRLCRLRSWRGLAFGLDAEIAPERVQWRQEHDVPLLDLACARWRDEIEATQGRRRTWYAGAWLGDGLHEGAFSSAERAARALG